MRYVALLSFWTIVVFVIAGDACNRFKIGISIYIIIFPAILKLYEIEMFFSSLRSSVGDRAWTHLKEISPDNLS